MKTSITALFISLWLFKCLHAGSRSSTRYSIGSDVTDTSGCLASSAAYTSHSSVGLIAGVSQVMGAAETAKHGYIAQLFDVTGLVMNAATPSVNETATFQLAAWQVLDDATFLAVPAESVAWSVVSGPITGISSGGVATAGLVFQDAVGSVQGSFAGETGSLILTVLDVIADNFGAYAGDGLGDNWQVQYFGQPPSALAGPLMDPDGDGQNNAFEYIAGLIPTDATSRFQLRMERVPGQPGRKAIIFSPVLDGRTYTVEYKATLAAPAWTTLTNIATSDNEDERTVIDLGAGGASRFYEVEITRP